MKCRFVILAEKVLLDFPVLNATAIGITDSIALAVRAKDEEGNRMTHMDAVPLSFTVLSTWTKEPEDPAGPIIFNLCLSGPGGTDRVIGQPAIEFGTHVRFQSRVDLMGLPYEGAGTYVLYTSMPAAPEVRLAQWSVDIQLDFPDDEIAAPVAVPASRSI